MVIQGELGIGGSYDFSHTPSGGGVVVKTGRDRAKEVSREASRRKITHPRPGKSLEREPTPRATRLPKAGGKHGASRPREKYRRTLEDKSYSKKVGTYNKGTATGGGKEM